MPANPPRKGADTTAEAMLKSAPKKVLATGCTAPATGPNLVFHLVVQPPCGLPCGRLGERNGTTSSLISRARGLAGFNETTPGRPTEPKVRGSNPLGRVTENPANRGVFVF